MAILTHADRQAQNLRNEIRKHEVWLRSTHGKHADFHQAKIEELRRELHQLLEKQP